MKHLKIITEIKQYPNIKALPDEEIELLHKAREAAKKSYAPYSNFKVGAALLLENGEIVTGNNQENAAYPSGLCAERTAIFWANAQYPHIAIKTMAVTAIKKGEIIPSPLSPCGSCRQVMIETETRFNTNIKTILDSQSEIWVIDCAKDLLPLFFYGKDLD
ncbi:cytidine deaminase [Saccharicrinis fermentans]|uniref:Cytidine deaminase n=1 Tax=Saccharicrinis fermentans DSM 9555 = JCM 21142 TaxID=869213 RepID=W7YIQ9_9BACT|nr:cytidine deaminase [Saccharicrinis fermentans]GAF04356.1 cytidine deaminase [Saccharicrinis fermentans DSM 9555 = JCM 21142]